MNLRSNLKNRLARSLTTHAMRVAAEDSAEWTRAMIHEQEHLPCDTSALSWALGCVFVSYEGRLRAMTRLPDLPRWLLLTVLLLCLGPASACFIFVATSTAQGYSPISMTPYTVIQQGLIFGSAALIGPIGLAAAFWTLCSSAHRLGRMLIALLWGLTGWALTVHVGLLALIAAAHVRGGPLELWFALFVPSVVLPAFAVTQLQWLDARRRASIGSVGSQAVGSIRSSWSEIRRRTLSRR